MGKRRKERVHEERGEGPHRERLSEDEKLSLKERISLKLEESNAQNTATTRLKFYPHWRKVCGVETDEEIDFDNPIVHLEWFLCDFRIQGKLMDGKREEVLEMMDDVQR